MKILKYILVPVLLIAAVLIVYFVVTREVEEIKTDNKMTHHGDPGERLRMIMQNINLTIHDSTNVDAQTDRISRQDMEDMIEVIEELVLYAEMMSTELPHPGLDNNEKVTFRAMAGQLYSEALNIQQTTRDYNLDTYDYEVLNINYRRLNETCVACHQMFRDR